MPRAVHQFSQSAVSFVGFGSCSSCKLRSKEAFCDLPVPELETLQQIRHPVHYPKGTTLFEEGDCASGVFIICSGRVKVALSSRSGKAIVVRTLGPGELVGVVSTMSGDPCELGAETADTSQLAFIEKKDFLQLIRRCEVARFHLVEHLSRKCNATRQIISTLYLSGSAAAKLAKMLLKASSQQSRDMRTQVELALTHDEIAERIDTARETVTRLMTALKQQKIVDISGSTLFIRNKSALKAIASRRYELRRSRSRSVPEEERMMGPESASEDCMKEQFD